MPSASAKTEKTALLEAADPVKQLSITLEKKVRNLEKRKLKLDNYKNDVQNGKELNEDQKLAVSKYDQVIEVLEYSKDLCKSLNAISQESVRLQKKIAKKEQIERQQHEIQRLQEAFYYKHILSSLETEEIRRDFLTGENGASKLSEDDVLHLDQFYKLIGPELPNDQADIEGHFHALAENMIFLVDGKNKDIVGTTYKALKDLLKGMKDSGYFSRASESAEVSSDEIPESEELEKHVSIEEEEEISNPIEELQHSPVDFCVNTEIPDEPVDSNGNLSDADIPNTPTNPETNVYNIQNGSLQDVLASQGSFNFLQESQIELDTPHMDPAVVAVHQMAPPPTAINYTVANYQVPPVIDKMPDAPIPNGIGIENSEISPPSQMTTMPVIANAVPRSISSVLTSVQHNGSPDFDPSHPIPTQTFTNQSFAIMQNMMVPAGAYVPVTMHHGHLSPHIAPIAVVPGLSPTVTSPTSSVPMHISVNSASVISETELVVANPEPVSPKEENELENPIVTENGLCPGPEMGSPQNGLPPERNHEGFAPNYRNRGRGRGRGSSNNYYRGRGNYNNGRGGYQSYNNYSTGWNPRRGGLPRGRSSGGIRGRGNFNNRSPQEPQQQQVVTSP